MHPLHVTEYGFGAVLDSGLLTPSIQLAGAAACVQGRAPGVLAAGRSVVRAGSPLHGAPRAAAQEQGWLYLGAPADVFSTDVQLCDQPVNLVKLVFLRASVFYNSAFDLFFLCLVRFLWSGTVRPPFLPGGCEPAADGCPGIAARPVLCAFFIPSSR